MTESNKDIIYIDIDDDITGIIAKVNDSKHKIVALVLPKRATVMQSVINMKLLKKACDEKRKLLVLITSEVNLMSLAGAVGIRTAKTLQSKPTIPDSPVEVQDDELLEDNVPNDTELEPGTTIDLSKSVGELAGLSVADETIDIDNEPVSKTNPKKVNKNSKKVKIPDFGRFRNRFFIGGLIGIGLAVLLILMLVVMPTAKITIKTDTQTAGADLGFVINTSATSADIASKTIQGTLKQVQKTDTQTTAATGKKDIGVRASGSATLTNCSNSPVSVPIGTAISANGLSFITQEAISLDSGNFTGGGTCKTSGSHVGTVSVVAQNSGTQYNVDAQTYAVAGSTTVKASGTAMVGGTSNMVTVISQQDVDIAKAKIVDNKNSANSELLKKLQNDKLFVINESFTTSPPTVTISPSIGDQASTVNVTSSVLYTMLGVKEDDLKQLINENVKSKIDIKKQAIQDYGLNKAIFAVSDFSDPKKINLSLQTTVTTGAKIDEESVKKQVAGLKKGDINQILGSQPGVKEVTVKYSPFWVNRTPKKISKITVIIQKIN